MIYAVIGWGFNWIAIKVVIYTRVLRGLGETK